MSTRSYIAKKLKDNTYKYIYCHSDGYLEHNGVILNKYYSKESEVDELLALGSISCLGNYPGDDDASRPDDVEYNKWYRRGMNQCIAYHRDMGREFEVFTTNDINDIHGAQDYTYVWDSDTSCWYVAEGSDRFMLLKDALEMNNRAYLNDNTARGLHLSVRDVVNLLEPSTHYIIQSNATGKVLYDSENPNDEGHNADAVLHIKVTSISKQVEPHISQIETVLCLVLADFKFD